MHIGVIGSMGPDLFADNICDALVRMGHRVTHLGSPDPRRGGRWGRRVAHHVREAAPRLERALHELLARRAVAHGCDAVLTTQISLAPEVVRSLRRHHLPVALWFPDAVCNLGRARMLAAPYSAMFLKDPLLVSRLRDVLGLPAWYLPEACNPRWHRPIGEGAVEPHIAVVGNSYVSRLVLVRRLHDAGIPLVIHGAPPPRWARDLLPPGLAVRPPVYREAKSRVFRSAAGVLNNLHLAEMSGVNCRLFEATAAGAAVLCETRPALGDLFDVDREVVPFTCFGELVDAARALLAEPRWATDIGDAASKRAHADHTYEARLTLLLERLG